MWKTNQGISALQPVSVDGDARDHSLVLLPALNNSYTIVVVAMNESGQFAMSEEARSVHTVLEIVDPRVLQSTGVLNALSYYESVDFEGL